MLEPIEPEWLLQKSASFSRPVVFHYTVDPRERAERAQRLWDALADGTLKVPAIERYTLDAAAQAHARLESRASIGPLVLLA